MAILFEGECNGRAVNPELGPDKNGKPRVKWTMQVVDGPHAGKTAAYSGKLDPENIKWTKRDMMTLGWRGKDVRTFVEDVIKANRTVPFTAEIALFERDDGTVSRWTSVRMGGGTPLGPLDGETAVKLNSWFAEAGDLDGGTAAAPPKDDGSIPF